MIAAVGLYFGMNYELRESCNCYIKIIKVILERNFKWRYHLVALLENADFGTQTIGNIVFHHKSDPTIAELDTGSNGVGCFCPHLKNRALKRWRWLIDLIIEYRYGSQVENRDAAYLTAMDF